MSLIHSDLQPIFPEHPFVRAVVWHLDGLRQEGMNPEIWLTKTELTALDEMRHERRRNEWIASRIALKRLLVSEGVVRSPLHAEIRKNEKGCPHIVVYVPDSGHYEEIPCSLSHKNQLVVAAFSRGGLRVGVDIEKRSWRISSLRRKFMSPEDHLLSDSGSSRTCTVLWTLKEATSKLIGTGFACGFTQIKCRETSLGDCEVFPPGSDTVLYGKYFFYLDKYAVSVVTDFPAPLTVPVKKGRKKHDLPPESRRSWYEQLSRARRLKKLRRQRAFAGLNKKFDTDID